jgi:hypothetical protein
LWSNFLEARLKYETGSLGPMQVTMKRKDTDIAHPIRVK